uniref:Secreted protein n=1 Tax=Magallana gigas TaxID=29159 RepID=A0A8W8NPN5_MAGGI
MWILMSMFMVCFLPSHLTGMRALDDYIEHYDELSYDTQSLRHRHLRTKRTPGTTPLQLKFQAEIFTWYCTRRHPRSLRVMPPYTTMEPATP